MLLLKKLKNELASSICLRQHAHASLLENLSLREFCRFCGKVRILESEILRTRSFQKRSSGCSRHAQSSFSTAPKSDLIDETRSIAPSRIAMAELALLGFANLRLTLCSE